jgi:hypothetical protein
LNPFQCLPVTALATAVIRRFERKFPDGAPEPDEDNPDTDEEDR